MNKSLKKKLQLIVIAGIIFALGWIVPDVFGLSAGVFTLSFMIAGWPVIKKAGRNILNGRVFDENFLMTIATFGAFVLKDYAEAAAVMLFFQVGEFFQNYAVNQSRKSIAKLMDIRPDFVRVQRGEKAFDIAPEEAKSGEIMLIKPGERIGLDGVVVSGNGSIDTSALTGEALPKEVEPGDEVISGSINLSGVLKVQISREYAQSTVARILELVENASTKKADLESFITRFARYYTPAVVVIATFLALLPPLLISGATFADWGYRAMTFLVISCPCALVISIPLSFFGGLGAASKCGILIKGSNYLEALARAEVVVFDKTGTLTEGKFRVSEVMAQGLERGAFLELLAGAEYYSNHPLAAAIREAAPKLPLADEIQEIQEIAGQGMKAKVKGHSVAAGNRKLMESLGLEIVAPESRGTAIFVAIDGRYSGYVVIGDCLKETAVTAVRALKNAGVRKTVMLTGDCRKNGEATAGEAGVDEVLCELLPEDKVKEVERLLAQKSREGALLFVGDGINDAPVLARADVGIAMGGIGSDAAIEAADAVIMNDELTKLAAGIKISRRTLAIARQNIVFAIGVKMVVLALGAMGDVSIWAAVFADVGVSVLAILNAIRALRLPKDCQRGC